MQPQKNPLTDKNTEIANDVLAHVNSGATDDSPLWAKHWSPDCVSVEGDGMEHAGLEAIKEKHAQWYGMVTMHSFSAEGPYVGPDGFAIKFTMDIEAKDGSWPRMNMSEIAYYTVSGGKVVRESFMGPPMG
ncbi:MAG: nuclear transport factor 2 family protein [Planctomycetota bacterium]